jgi:hypothetical protein
MQDSTKIRSEILIRNCFKSRADTWHVLTGAYQFVRIGDVSRRIKLDLDGSDLLVPLGLSDLFWGLRSRSDGYDKKGRKLTGEVRVPARNPARSVRWWSPAGLQGLLDDGEDATGIGATWGARG